MLVALSPVEQLIFLMWDSLFPPHSGKVSLLRPAHFTGLSWTLNTSHPSSGKVLECSAWELRVQRPAQPGFSVGSWAQQ